MSARIIAKYTVPYAALWPAAMIALSGAMWGEHRLTKATYVYGALLLLAVILSVTTLVSLYIVVTQSAGDRMIVKQAKTADMAWVLPTISSLFGALSNATPLAFIFPTVTTQWLAFPLLILVSLVAIYRSKSMASGLLLFTFKYRTFVVEMDGRTPIVLLAKRFAISKDMPIVAVELSHELRVEVNNA